MATKPDIAEYFENVNFLNGQDGIHFIINEANVENGQAFIQLADFLDLKTALRINKNFMGNRHIEGMYSVWYPKSVEILLNFSFNQFFHGFSAASRRQSTVRRIQ